MTVEQPAPAPSKKKTAARVDFREQVILSAPVFLLYHLGLLLAPRAVNGVDPLTRLMGALAGMSTALYLLVMAALCAAYLLWIRRLKKTGRFRPRRFPLLLVEAAVYAAAMAPLANLLLREMHVLAGRLAEMGALDRVVASAGAGFYEELVFRLGGIGVLVFLFQSRRVKRWLALTLAVLATSLIFSLAHYLGAGSEAFAVSTFAFRAVLGIVLALVYVFRGFATAVYAHFLYDLYVMCVWMD